ncbi:MAG: PA2169 family four-helix-bundle protein [Cyclobacteriaceae bacterium]
MNYDIKSEIEQIIETNIDAAKGYEKAAEKLNDSELSTIFNRLAQQRKQFNEEIINELRPLGVTPETSGTTKGYFHRTWMDVSTAFSGNKDEQIIDESITGESTSLERYDEIIKKEILPQPVQERVANQKSFIYGAIDQLKEFKQSVN